MESQFKGNQLVLPPEIEIPLLSTGIKSEDLASNPYLPENTDREILRSTVITQAREIGRLTGALERAYIEIDRLKDRATSLNSKMKEKNQTIKGYRRLVTVMQSEKSFTFLHDFYLGALYFPGIRIITDRWLKKDLAKDEEDIRNNHDL